MNLICWNDVTSWLNYLARKLQLFIFCQTKYFDVSSARFIHVSYDIWKLDFKIQKLYISYLKI